MCIQHHYASRMSTLYEHDLDYALPVVVVVFVGTATRQLITTNPPTRPDDGHLIAVCANDVAHRRKLSTTGSAQRFGRALYGVRVFPQNVETRKTNDTIY